MKIVEQIVFLILLGFAAYQVGLRVRFVWRNIRLGLPLPIYQDQSTRFKNMMLMAVGQKKMFDKPLVGLMHLIIYAGFFIINIELLEIVLDGLLGTHRLFAPYLGEFYTLIINTFEVLALGVIVVCVIFLARRNIIKLYRLNQIELKGFPHSDANIILVIEILLMSAFLTMNAADAALQAQNAAHYPAVGPFLVSSWLLPLFENWSITNLIYLERAAWWFHIMGIFGFMVYLGYSKHLHIMLAFPTTYFARLSPRGQMVNMPAITNEVRGMLNLPVDAGNTVAVPARFGAKDIDDLNQKHLLDAYSCTECGRCTAQCPANITGRKLSPRKIMMDTRDRMEEVGHSLDTGGPGLADGKSLYKDYISEEELLACTSCNACVEACPVNINPLDIILELRRYMAMEVSTTPGQWNLMFSNLENNMAPWKYSASEREKWIPKA